MIRRDIKTIRAPLEAMRFRGAIAVLTAILVLQAGGLALALSQADDEPIEEIEEIEEVEPVEEVVPVAAAADGSAAKGTLGFQETVGRLHPSVVHMPIAWLLLLLLTDVLGFALGKEPFRKVGIWLAGLTVLSFGPAIGSGLTRVGYQPYATLTEGAVFTHRNLMLLTVGLALTAFLLRLARKNDLEGVLKWVYLVLVLAAAAAVTAGAHIGGELVYGENYLPF